jgi:PAS domain S-box-containing protein
LQRFDLKTLQSAVEYSLEAYVRDESASWPTQWASPILAKVGEAILVTNAVGEIVMMNPVAEKLTGWNERKARGRRLEEIVPLLDGKSGRPFILQVPKDSDGIESFGGTRRVSLKSPGGSAILVAGQTAAIYDSSRQFQGTICCFQDVTGRLQTEDRLFQKSFELQAICSTFPDYYFRLDAQGTVLDCLGSQNWEMPGQPDSLLGRKIQEAFPPPVRHQFLEALARLRKSRGPVSLTFALMLPKGERNYEARLVSSLDNEILFVVRDNTENRQAQEALRLTEEQLRQAHKMEAIGKLAGGVAHDFNNLLTAITGYSDILLKRLSPDDSCRHEVMEIRQAGERASQLTSQLLAFSRKQVLAPKLIDLNVVVSNMYRMLRRLIGEDIELVTRAGRDLALVKADPGQMEQVILNLAVNGRDAMPRGGGLVLETTNINLEHGHSYNQLAVPPGPYVMLAVVDNGCGMDADTRSHLFEPYFTTKDKGKGTGFGLSTVYGVVKQSGGSILVYSEPGKGSRFEIYLPLAEPRVETIEAVKDPLVMVRGSETVLLVEDEEVIRRMVHAILHNSGYKVLQACHGLEALKLSREYDGTIHMMLTDVVMPEMSGYLLAEKLIALRPELRVLFMSGYSDETIRQHGEWHLEAPFIHKPFTPEGLNHKIRQVLDAEPAYPT